MVQSTTRSGAEGVHIRAVTRLTGLSAEVVRAWERRYGVPSPSRSPHGQRLFRPDEVEELREMKRLRERGIGASRAAGLVRAARDRQGESIGAQELHHDAFRLATWAIVDAVARLDDAALVRAVEGAISLGTSGEVAERVLAPALAAISARSTDGAADLVAMRLFAGTVTALVRHGPPRLRARALTAAPRVLPPATPLRDRRGEPLSSSPRTRLERERIVLATIGDERSDLERFLLATILAEAGLRPVDLGARVTPHALATAVEALAPRLVVLALSAPIDPATAPNALASYAAACTGARWGLGGCASAPFVGSVEAAGGIVLATDLVASRARIVHLATTPLGPRRR